MKMVLRLFLVLVFSFANLVAMQDSSFMKSVEIVPQKGHKTSIHTFELVHNEQLLLVIDYRSYNLWDVRSAKLIYSETIDGELTNFCLSKNKEFAIFSITKNGQTKIYRKSLSSLMPLFDQALKIQALSFIKRPLLKLSNDDNYLAVVSGNHKDLSAVYDLKAQKTLWKRSLGMGYFITTDTYVKISEDRSKLLVHSRHYPLKQPAYEETKVIDLKTGNELQSLPKKANYHKLFGVDDSFVLDFGNGIYADQKKLFYTLNKEKIWGVQTTSEVGDAIVDLKTMRVFLRCKNGDLEIRSLHDGILLHSLSQTLGETQNILGVGKTDLAVEILHENNRYSLSIWDIDGLRVSDSFEGEKPLVVEYGKYILYQKQSETKRFDKDKYLYDLRLQKNIHKFTFEPLAVDSDNGFILGYDSKDGKVFLFDSKKQKLLNSFEVGSLKNNTKITPYSFHHHRISQDFAYIKRNNEQDIVINFKTKKFYTLAKNYEFAGFDPKRERLLVKNKQGKYDTSLHFFDMNSGEIAQAIALKPDRWIQKDLQFVTQNDTFWICSWDSKNLLHIEQYSADTYQYIKSIYKTLFLDKLFFSPDKEHFYTQLNGTFELRKSTTGELVKKIDTKQTQIETDTQSYMHLCPYCSRVAFLDDFNLIVDKKAIYKENEKVGSFLGDKNRWLFYSDDGYFTASLNGTQLVALKKGLQGLGIDQLALVKNRPDILLERVASKSEARIEYYKKRYLLRLQKANMTASKQSSLPAEVKIISTLQNNNELTLSFEAIPTTSSLKSYTVFVNDTPIESKEFAINSNSYQITTQLKLYDLKNKIEVGVFDTNGVESFRDMRMIYLDKAIKGDLYFIALGVSEYQDKSLNLQYAHKDVIDLETLFKKQENSALYENVKTFTFINSEANSNVLEKLKTKIGSLRAQDTLVMFIAGHGVYDADGSYYYLTHDADVANLSTSALSFEAIEELLYQADARKKLFLMDTCQSGEQEENIEEQFYAMAELNGYKPRTTRALKIKKQTQTSSKKDEKSREWLLQRDRFLFADLVRKTGAIVFSSSLGSEFSYESSTIKNGYFTDALKQALSSNAADGNKDKIVTTSELREFVSKEVSKNTKNMQNPTVDRDNLEVSIGFEL